MHTQKSITIVSNRRKRTLSVNHILYIHMRRKHADVHMDNGEVIETRTTYKEFCDMLGDAFIEVRRGNLVSVIAIHDVTDMVNLNNGMAVEYTINRKEEIENRLYQRQRNIIMNFSTEGIPGSFEEYREYYKSYENMPFAFTDIEMIFDDDCRAVDWVFRYGKYKETENYILRIRGCCFLRLLPRQFLLFCMQLFWPRCIGIPLYRQFQISLQFLIS